MCFCVLLYFTACMLYYCNTVGCTWWDWGLIWWLTILLQCFDTVGWVTWPIKISSPNDLYCVEWDVKPYSTQLPSRYLVSHPGKLSPAIPPGMEIGTWTKTVQDHPRSKVIMSIGRPLVVSYMTSIESNLAFLTAFEIFDVQVLWYIWESSRSSKVEGHSTNR